MRYEIINPSDQCFVSADGEKADQIAFVAGILLGNGLYGMQDESGRTVLPIVFTGWREVFHGLFGEEIEPFMLAHAAAIADCLATFEYARPRTSLNNIGLAAKDSEQWLRNLLGKAGVPDAR